MSITTTSEILSSMDRVEGARRALCDLYFKGTTHCHRISKLELDLLNSTDPAAEFACDPAWRNPKLKRKMKILGVAAATRGVLERMAHLSDMLAANPALARRCLALCARGNQ